MLSHLNFPESTGYQRYKIYSSFYVYCTIEAIFVPVNHAYGINKRKKLDM